MRVKYHRSLAHIVPYLYQTILSQNARFHGASRELCRTLFQWIAITPIAPQGSPCQALLFVHSIPKFRKTFVPCARPRLRTQVRPLPPFRKTRHGAQRNDAPARSGITNDTAATPLLRTATGCHAVEGPTLDTTARRYGNAVLTRWPVRASRAIDLSFGRREPRGARDVDIGHAGETLPRVAQIRRGPD